PARARPAGEVPARPRGLHGPAGHDPGDRALAQAAAARRLERGSPLTGALLLGGARRGRRPHAAARRARQRAGLAPLRGPNGRAAGPRGVPPSARRRDGPPLPGAAAPLAGLLAPRLP